MADIFADHLAEDKVRASLSACTSCSAVAALRLKPNSLVNQVMRFSRVSKFGAIVLDEVAGVMHQKGGVPSPLLPKSQVGLIN